MGLIMNYVKKEEHFSIKGINTFIFQDVLTGYIIRENVYENLITTACLTMIAARLAGGSDDTDITYGAVGTDDTAPAISDTTLGTENTRKALASISSSGGVITAVTFFGASDANAVLKEFGLFGNGATAAADSGTLVNHVAIDEEKTSSETLTVESVLTLTGST